MKKILLWFIHSFIYLVPACFIVAGVFIFIKFIPNYSAPLIILWIIIVSFVYIKYNRWY